MKWRTADMALGVIYRWRAGFLRIRYPADAHKITTRRHKLDASTKWAVFIWKHQYTVYGCQ